MAEPPPGILGKWTIQDSDNTETYPDGNTASFGWNSVQQKGNMTWTTEGGRTYTMHKLKYSEPGGVPTFQGTLVGQFCATFTFDLNVTPNTLSADIADGPCAALDEAEIEPPLIEEDSLAGTWSSNQRPG